MDRLLEKSRNEKSKENVKNARYETQRKKKVYRGKGKNKESKLCIMSTNCAQLKGKLDSFKSELRQANVGLFTLQETHCVTKGKIKIPDFEIFESIRKKAKGGTMLGAHKALKPFLIIEYNDAFELLVVEINIANRDVRVINQTSNKYYGSPRSADD